MPDRLVQQHSGPTRSEHHGRGARRRGLRVEIDQRLTHRLARVGAGAVFRVGEVVVVVASASAGRCLLAPPVTFDDDAHVHPHQRAHVAGEGAVAGRDEDPAVFAGEADDDLVHVRVELPGFRVDALQQGDTRALVERLDRIEGGVERRSGRAPPGPDAAVAARARDAARGRRRMSEGAGCELVGVREPALLATHRPHPDALLDVVAALLHDAVFKHPCLGPCRFEVEIRLVDGVLAQPAQSGFEIPFGEIAGCENVVTNDVECLTHALVRRGRGGGHEHSTAGGARSAPIRIGKDYPAP